MQTHRPSLRVPWITSVTRLAFTGAGLLLVVFHAIVFAVQVARGALVDPMLALRWVAAAGLALAIFELRRRGASLVGRRAVAVWVLAAVLHAPAVTASTTGADAPALPEAIVNVLQVGIGGTGLGLLLLIALALRPVGPPTAVRLRLQRSRRVGGALVGRRSPFAPRPPPCA